MDSQRHLSRLKWQKISTMNTENNFLKQIEAYFDLNFNTYDKDRILGYLTEYLNTLPPVKPQIILSQKTVYKYIKQSLELSNDENNSVLIEPLDILKIVAEISGVDIEKMKGKRRETEIVLPRHVAMFFVKEKCHEKITEIGKLFNRDHTSVIHGVRHVRDMLEVENSKYTKLVQQVTSALPKPIKKSA